MFLTGDVMLVCGTSRRAKGLVLLQKPTYSAVRSSHVLIAVNEGILLDAMPSDGVRHRNYFDVIQSVEPDFRVIRKVGVPQPSLDSLQKSSLFFLGQDYKFHFKDTPKTSESYCSELVRKIYERAEVASNIPSGFVLPAHFDELADLGGEWTDVTATVKHGMHSMSASMLQMMDQYRDVMIKGIKLNRKRFVERDQTRAKFKKMLKAKSISQTTYDEVIAKLEETEAQMNFEFWDRGARPY